jgi:hypothetical protein
VPADSDDDVLARRLAVVAKTKNEARRMVDIEMGG